MMVFYPQVRKASTMLEMIVWDPCSRIKQPLSVANVPAEHNFRGTGATFRGNLYTLETVGKVLQFNADTVLAIIFDAHGSHVFCRKLLHGQLEKLHWDDLKHVPFFSELKFSPLPTCSLPRLPIQVTTHKGHVIWGIPGVCDLVWNQDIDLWSLVFVTTLLLLLVFVRVFVSGIDPHCGM